LTPKLLGDPPLALGPEGKLKNTIGTVFPDDRAIITGRGIHGLLRLSYLDQLRQERLAQDLPPLTRQEELARQERAVDLVLRGNMVYIRPDPEAMDLAFAADELLQPLAPKSRIRFLGVLDPQVRQAIQRRGECWRISPLPRTVAEMQAMIAGARGAIGTSVQYYHNMETGTRYLTCQEFERLGGLPPDRLAACLEEVKQYSARRTKSGQPEVALFKADETFGAAALQGLAFSPADEPRLREIHEGLRRRFFEAVRPDFQKDDDRAAAWRVAMLQALMSRSLEGVPEEVLLGLSPEFHLRVHWLPGARLEQGEVVYDSVFDENPPAAQEGKPLCDERVRSILVNLLRQYDYQVEYLNIAAVPETLSNRPPEAGRRGVYVAEIKETGKAQETVKLLRMQKWDVREHIEEGKDFLQSILEAQEYTEYVLDRHLGCKQLGMSRMPAVTGMVAEAYPGSGPYHGKVLRLTYFQRDYVRGLATDKIPPSRYAVPEFSTRLARLLGEAAAPNLVVGRMSPAQLPRFDDGDEVIVEDAEGLPRRIIVTDSSGSFVDYREPFEKVIPHYAKVITRRKGLVPNLEVFGELFVHAFVTRLEHLQEQFLRRPQAFRALFRHRRCDEAGSFGYRWLKVLERLEAADPTKLGGLMRAELRGKL
jgi:hypothetical protein